MRDCRSTFVLPATMQPASGRGTVHRCHSEGSGSDPRNLGVENRLPKSIILRLRDPSEYLGMTGYAIWWVAMVMASTSTSFAAQIDVKHLDRDRVPKAADGYLNEAPITVTAAISPRSAGGKHDFFSEGDYWWP